MRSSKKGGRGVGSHLESLENFRFSSGRGISRAVCEAKSTRL
jgi:hypothetical protein